MPKIYYNKVSKFRIELSLMLKLYEIYQRYGIKLICKVKHGELCYNDILVYRAGCINRLVKILNNSEELYNEAHNRLFTKIEELSPRIIKVRA